MEIKRIKLTPTPPNAATTQAPPTQPERAPIDLARFYEGSSADTFMKDDTNPRIEDPFEPHEEESRPVKTVKITSSTHSLEPQERPAMKTMEMAHLAHLSHLPTQRVNSPSGSLFNRMSGEGEDDQAILYARYAAALADMEKKKKRKKKRWRTIWDFFRSLFDKS